MTAVTKRLDLPLLTAELAAASVAVGGLGTTGGLETADYAVWTYAADGALIDLPPEADPVLASHTAPPLVVDYVATQSVSAVLRTTDDQLHEVFRLPTTPKHVYGAALRMTAVDAISGATKRARADMTFKGLAASVVQVGTTVISTPMQDAAASTWVIQPTTDGIVLVISVKGAAGRTVDWTLAGDVEVFSPEGL